MRTATATPTPLIHTQTHSFNLVVADDLASSLLSAISEESAEDKRKEIQQQAEGPCANTGIVTQISLRDRREARTARHLKGFLLRRGQLGDSMEDLRIWLFLSCYRQVVKGDEMALFNWGQMMH